MEDTHLEVDLQSKESIKVKGHNLSYTRQGSGEPILFIHGITTHSFIWRNMLPAMSKSFNCIAVDLLGCGDSDKPRWAEYSISAQADLLLEMLNELGVKRFPLVAHDIGGSTMLVVPTGGHFIQEDEPELLVDEISHYIESRKVGNSKPAA